MMYSTFCYIDLMWLSEMTEGNMCLCCDMDIRVHLNWFHGYQLEIAGGFMKNKLLPCMRNTYNCS